MLDFHQKGQKIPKQKQKEVLLSINTNSPFTKLVTSVHELTKLGIRFPWRASLCWISKLKPDHSLCRQAFENGHWRKVIPMQCEIQVCAELANSNHCEKVCAGFDSKHIIYI